MRGGGCCSSGGIPVTLKPPKPSRIYVVLIDPSTKPKKTKSLTVYNISLEDAFERVKGCFAEKQS